MTIFSSENRQRGYVRLFRSLVAGSIIDQFGGGGAGVWNPGSSPGRFLVLMLLGSRMKRSSGIPTVNGLYDLQVRLDCAS